MQNEKRKARVDHAVSATATGIITGDLIYFEHLHAIFWLPGAVVVEPSVKQRLCVNCLYAKSMTHG